MSPLLQKDGALISELPAGIARRATVQKALSLIRPLAEVEQAAIESAMILCEGNVAKAARHLQIKRSTLASRLKKIRAQA